MLGTAFAPRTTTAVDAATPQQLDDASRARSPKFINAQRQDQWLASKFKGTDVVGPQDEKIGDVSDILFDKDGKVVAYVVGVGGFLGIGAKDVALAPIAFQVVPGDKSKNESDKLRLSMTKDQLKQAATSSRQGAAHDHRRGLGAARRSPTTRPAPGNPAIRRSSCALSVASVVKSVARPRSRDTPGRPVVFWNALAHLAVATSNAVAANIGRSHPLTVMA